MSALPPQKADILCAKRDVRFGSKADICAAIGHVRFTPKSDIECVLWRVRFGPIADTVICANGLRTIMTTLDRLMIVQAQNQQ
jgi:hypothetical protein